MYLWRSLRALAVEMRGMQARGIDGYLMAEYLPQVQRYVTAAHNGKVKTLSLLEPYRIPPVQDEEAVDPVLLPSSEGSPQASTEIATDDSPASDPVRSDGGAGDPGTTISEPSPITVSVQ